MVISRPLNVNRKRKPVMANFVDNRKIPLKRTDIDHLESIPDSPISYLVEASSTTMETPLGQEHIGSALLYHGNRIRLRRRLAVFPVSSSAARAPSTCTPASETTTPEPSTRTPASETTTPEPSACTPASETTTPEPSTCTPASETTTPEPFVTLETETCSQPATPETISLVPFDGPPDLSLKSILLWWTQKNLVQDEPQQLLVCRDFILKSTLRIVQRQDFNFCKDFQVVFSGEDGDDLGGPKREFLRLLMNEVINRVFQGNERNKFFVHNIEKLSKGEYEMAGKFTAFSLLHGGPGISVINIAVYEYMTGQEITSIPSINEYVFDEDVRKRLLQIKNATQQSEYQEALDSSSDWCSEKGLSLLKFKEIKDKENLLRVLITNEIIYSVHTEIDQFRSGLMKVGLLYDAVMLNPCGFKSLFCDSTGRQRLKFGELRSLYKVNYSDQGSNNRRMERCLPCRL